LSRRITTESRFESGLPPESKFAADATTTAPEINNCFQNAD
jgi:hypothetical protein